MWAWMLHRITGLCIILFVGLHVFASFFMQQFGSDAATSINIVYEFVGFPNPCHLHCDIPCTQWFPHRSSGYLATFTNVPT